MSMPIEAGVTRPDPVYIRQRIPKLTQMISDEMRLFEGQMYMMDSLAPNTVNSEMPVIANQAFIHFANLHQTIEQLRQAIEIVNGNRAYFDELTGKFATMHKFGWEAYVSFEKVAMGAFKQAGLDRWMAMMKATGRSTAQLRGLGGGVSDFSDTQARTAVMPKTGRITSPDGKVVKAQEVMADPKMDVVKKEPIPRIHRPLSSEDFKAPAQVEVNDEIRNHLPPQVYQKQVPVLPQTPQVTQSKPTAKRRGVKAPAKKAVKQKSFIQTKAVTEL